jgi:hypothetical protein
MSNLHRTQIYIEEEQIHQLRLEAEREHLAVSELIRRAIQYLLEKRTRTVSWDNDPLSKAVGRIKLDVSDASLDHNRYLYGRKEGA